MTVRPEFDVTLAFNPASVLIPVNRIEGIGWTLIGAGSGEGGSIIGGQGAVMRLDGSVDPAGPNVLFVDLGSDAAELRGRSDRKSTRLKSSPYCEPRIPSSACK